jgi:acyl-coenzyme A thioesterase PaaI-like protein
MSGDRVIPPHQPNCMGCGPQNPVGLGVTPWMEGDAVTGRVRFARRHEGAPGIAHGGAVAAALDDALGRLPMALGRPAVTARLEVDFHAPALLERELSIAGRVEAEDPRTIHATARLVDGDTIVATARAALARVTLEHFGAGGEDGPSVLREIWAPDEST